MKKFHWTILCSLLYLLMRHHHLIVNIQSKHDSHSGSYRSAYHWRINFKFLFQKQKIWALKMSIDLNTVFTWIKCFWNPSVIYRHPVYIAQLINRGQKSRLANEQSKLTTKTFKSILKLQYFGSLKFLNKCWMLQCFSYLRTTFWPIL